MNWIIRKTKKMDYHTDLSVIVKPFYDFIDNYNWLISDLEFMGGNELPVNHEEAYFILSPNEFKELLNSKAQIIWGTVLGVPIAKTIDVKQVPYVEDNPLIWEDSNLQYASADFEIDCIDSSCTIVKFTNKNLSDKFKSYFGDEAITLEKFNQKYK